MDIHKARYYAMLALVKSMRDAQKAYFKSRSTHQFTVCKRLEANVDRTIGARIAEIQGVQTKIEDNAD